MKPTHRTLIAAAGLALALSGAASARQEGPEASGHRRIKDDLAPDTFEKFRALIRPRADEFQWLKVHWLTDAVAARKKAAAEDKPIVVLRTGGAGYNDPLGAC